MRSTILFLRLSISRLNCFAALELSDSAVAEASAIRPERIRFSMPSCNTSV